MKHGGAILPFDVTNQVYDQDMSHRKKEIRPVYDNKGYTHSPFHTDVQQFSHQQSEWFTNTSKYRNVSSPIHHRGAERLDSSPSDISKINENYKLDTDQFKEDDYYYDPNHSVDRLRSLVADEQNGRGVGYHNSEIESILQELREHGIITD